MARHAWASVAGVTGTTGFHRRKILRERGKDGALLFRVEKGQFLCSGLQTEHERHIELCPQAVHDGEGNTSSHWLFLQEERHQWKKTLGRSTQQSKL